MCEPANERANANVQENERTNERAHCSAQVYIACCNAAAATRAGCSERASERAGKQTTSRKERSNWSFFSLALLSFSWIRWLNKIWSRDSKITTLVANLHLCSFCQLRRRRLVASIDEEAMPSSPPSCKLGKCDSRLLLLIIIIINILQCWKFAQVAGISRSSFIVVGFHWAHCVHRARVRSLLCGLHLVIVIVVFVFVFVLFSSSSSSSCFSK